MASGVRFPGSEFFIPDGCLEPRSWNTASGKEFPLSLQYHPIDILFNFGVTNTAVPPATGIWDVFAPRAAGVITEVKYRVNTNGSETNDNDVVNVQLNGSDKLTNIIIRDSTTEDSWLSATITGGSFAFVADDIISVDWTNTNTSDATGLNILIRGYYVGE